MQFVNIFTRQKCLNIYPISYTTVDKISNQKKKYSEVMIDEVKTSGRVGCYYKLNSPFF